MKGTEDHGHGHSPELEMRPDRMTDAEQVAAGGITRRAFLGGVGALGASAALAGTGCSVIRKPVERILPYNKRPEDLIPGKPVYYATAHNLGPWVQGLLVETQDGRPTKIEGNPRHHGSGGKTNAWSQASVLDLYDTDRSTAPAIAGEPATWAAAYGKLDELAASARTTGGAGLGLVIPTVASPTMREALAAFAQAFPKARIYRADPLYPERAGRAAEATAGQPARVDYDLEQADVLVALDLDFLGHEQDMVRNTRAFARRRKVEGPESAMNRLYTVEPLLSITGGMSDHRLRLQARRIEGFTRALAARLFGAEGVSAPAGTEAAFAAIGAGPQDLTEEQRTFVDALARDLKAHRGSAVVMVGERQPPAVHAIANLINAALGAFGKSFLLRPSGQPTARGMTQLAEDAGSKALDTIICLETNPAYDAPAGLGLADSLARIGHLVHAGRYRDETGKLAALHLPVSHYLEAWGDLEAPDGQMSLVQPMIAPLHDTPSALEVLGRFVQGKPMAGYEMVRAFWRGQRPGRFDEKTWRRWLHTGLVEDVPVRPSLPARWSGIAELVGEQAPAAAEGYEVNFHLDPRVLDGRFANNGWLQELPDPVSKLTWDNAALASKKTLAELGVESGDLLAITVGDRTMELPAWEAPGQAERTISLNLGNGRKGLGEVAEGAGFDVSPLRPVQGDPWIAGGAQVKKASGHYPLATTQQYGRQEPPVGSSEPRPLIREADLSLFKKDPSFATKLDAMPADEVKTWLWDPPPLDAKQQWGMSIDLNACTGCNACAIACQSENNIPVVGKDRVIEGREMSWIRLDRYEAYAEDDHDHANPQVSNLPMACQQCETAPCESVCPVQATAHSPEGLNDMAYNRCIGTRYCSNNCPYKVRRFNFFQYNGEISSLAGMEKNPDVTIRFRGVMEKCTYCVQRITESRIDAKANGDGVIPDISDEGARTRPVVTACQQACPADAIVFGDIANPESAVSKAKASTRDYGVLSWLNTKPRTTYLAKLRNPNPELAEQNGS